MIITGSSAKVSNVRGVCARAAVVIFLTSVLILSACSGGGGSKSGPSGPAGLPGVSGRICLTGETTYNVSVDGEDVRDVQAETPSSLLTYSGSVGGQVRAAKKIDISFAGQPVNEILAWGSGGSVKYGNTEAVAGTIPLSHPGAVMDLSSTLVDGLPVLVYAAERGIGLIVAKDGGIAENADAYYPVPAGVLSVSANADGSAVSFTTRDGYLQKTSVPSLIARESCAEVLTSSNALKVSDKNYFPFKAEIGDKYAFVLAKESETVPSIAPTFSETYNPIFSAMLYGGTPAIVRAIGISDHKIFEAGLATTDGSFHYYDSFIPTDIAFNDGTLFVAGLAYRSSSIQNFMAANCTTPGDQAQFGCLVAAAKNATLTLFQDDGVFPMTAGVFIYRNLDDLTKPNHFMAVPLSAFQHSPTAPPFVFSIAASGGTVYMRGPNFLVSLNHAAGSPTSESWDITASSDMRTGLVVGIPNDVAMFGGGAVSSFTAIRDQYGTGASSIEFADLGGQSKLIDTGSIYTRVQGASGNLLAVIEMTSGRGGNLYIENLAPPRTPVSNFDYPNAYVAQAAYSDQVLALAWSSTGTADFAESAQNWRIAVQDGANKQSRSVEIPSTPELNEFKGFPVVSASDPKPWLTRGVADIELGTSQRMAVLYSGFAGSTWYHRVGLYSYAKVSGRYVVTAIGFMPLFNSQGAETDFAGKILGIAQNADNTRLMVHFSIASGIYGWAVTPSTTGTATESGSASPIFQISPIIDATRNANGGGSIAIATGDTILIKDLQDPSVSQTIDIARREGSTRPALTGGKVALKGNILAVVAPYTALDPFSIFKRSGTEPFASAMTCSTCAFLDVKMFGSSTPLADYIAISSASSGIEFYEMNGM